MSFQLYLILLVTSVLAEKDKATTGQYFHWGEVDFQSVSLSWETEKLHSLLDAEITIKAVLTPGPGPERSTIAYLSDGEVTLDGLIPNSSYAVTAAVVRGKTTILELKKNIQTKVVDKSLIEKFFHWGPITAKSISLRWDLEGQDDLLDGVIQMTAVRNSDPTSKTTTSEPFSKGKATLDGLVSNSLYAVTVTGLVEGYKYFDFTENIKTLDTGHGKGGVARTGGFGITSVVVGLLFTCMALVLD
ncbi:45 kDa antigen [Taenia solium]|eukprot:TsM_000203200 transcript=TsM_000203200 gene=TsM_000203200